jgi:hypothetical protein
MDRVTQGRGIGRLAWGFILGWVVLLLVGFLWRLPYVERRYAGITLPFYSGCMVLALSLASLSGGSIWRGRHPRVARATAPSLYWGMVTLMFGAGAALLGVGVYHLVHRP